MSNKSGKKEKTTVIPTPKTQFEEALSKQTPSVARSRKEQTKTLPESTDDGVELPKSDASRILSTNKIK
jgi:hypothetical protein